MSISLWQKSGYKAKIPYLVNTKITEYDISKANINVLRDAGVLSEDQYQYLYNCPTQERYETIGKLQGRDTKVTEVLKAGIMNAKKVFMESNNIDDSRIIDIRNDALIVAGPQATVLDITERVKFRIEAVYSSLYRINSIDLYYDFNRVCNTEVLVAKGLGKIETELHKNYMLEFLAELFYCIQIEGVESAITLLRMLYENYIKKELEIEFYREFRPNSAYRIISNLVSYPSVYMNSITEYDKIHYLDISSLNPIDTFYLYYSYP